MSEHSNIIGGSTAARRIHCPGSYALEKTLPRGGPASEFAERGTALHEAVEDYLLNCENQPVECLMGVEYNGFIMDEQLIDEKIKPALKALDEIIAEAGGDLDYFTEIRLSMGDVIDGAFGTVDILGKGVDGRLWVIDWKFGDGVPVSPVENYQMAFYAACALLDPNKDLAEMLGDEALDIVFVIVQPRVGHPDEPDWQMWETTDEWVQAFIDTLESAYAKMMQVDAPLNTGEHCRWCDAKPICPKQQSQIGSVVSAMPIDPGMMDAVTLSSWLDKVESVEPFIKELKQLAHYEAERGVKIPGWKVVASRPSRKYIDAKKASSTLIRALKTEAAHKPRELITPPQAEKKLGKEKYTKLLAKNVEKVSSGTTLVRDDDKRPDVSDPSKSLGTKLRASLAAAGKDVPEVAQSKD